MQRIYAGISIQWQLTMQSIREKLECEELLQVPNASGKAAFGRVLSVLIFVGMIVGGGSYVWSL